MNLEEIEKQAKYCLNCKTKPCTTGCPLQNNIPDFIECIKDEKYEEAFRVLLDTTIFESICGRICPHSPDACASNSHPNLQSYACGSQNYHRGPPTYHILPWWK